MAPLPTVNESDAASTTAASTITNTAALKQPVCLLMVGMAGSGKTTLMQRLCSEMNQRQLQSYVVNLDPATARVPYPANIDIRDTVDYKKIMSQYHLGPNGAILTALNLFTTKFGQVLDLIDRRCATTAIQREGQATKEEEEEELEGDEEEQGSDESKLDYVLIDTPGQIEIFTWSASGQIIQESLAMTYPTVLVYVIDTPRTTNPTTFMSNMLYACSILYKSKLPFVIVFNKTDVVDHRFAVDWMRDFESFQEAIQTDSSYMGSLVLSMGLVLDEFYQHLRVVGYVLNNELVCDDDVIYHHRCSAMIGTGFDEFFGAVQEAVSEYDTVYRPEMERAVQEKLSKQAERQDSRLLSMLKDMRMNNDNENQSKQQQQSE
jgi:GTPase SAR1 family protein